MNAADFDYALPPERIAQWPTARRDAARLMVLGRASGAVAHRKISDLVQLLRQGDLLVLNNTRVVPARLVGRKSTGGRVELLLLERLGGRAPQAVWRCMIRSSRVPAPGAVLQFKLGLTAEVLERSMDGLVVRLQATPASQLEELLLQVGQPPLPPYITRRNGSPVPVDDRERYQTVFAERPGAVAAPTAGLHFTRELLDRLVASGIELAYLTLHVGLGTFLPLRVSDITEHRMHDEAFELPAATAAAVEGARRRGGRVVAVGTTVVRVLESCAEEGGRVSAASGRCELYVYPGFRFRVVDALLTNFHLPRSTLLILVAAFAGRERLLRAYGEAIATGYRFYSYGDAMLIGELQ